MGKKVKTISFEEKYGLGPYRKPETLTKSEKLFLKENSYRLKEIIRRGKSYLKYETRLFGGSPKPHHPGFE